MSRSVLGISWVHGHLQAAAVMGSRTSEAWSCPTPVVQWGDFEPALAEAIRQTGFHGHRVVVVLEHRNLLFHVQETPPAKGKVLNQLLQRLVAQSHFFEERAAWGHVELPPLQGRPRHLLALLPDPLIKQLSAACSLHHLQLSAVVPISAVLGEQLRQASLPKTETLILAAELEGSLQLLLGRADGQVLFSRNVMFGSAQQRERAIQEISRTLHYAQQQFGAVVNHLVVLGERTLAGLGDGEIREGLQMQRRPEPQDSFYLAHQAGAISRAHPLNLISRTESRQRQGRQWIAAALIALFLITAAAVALIEHTVRAREILAISLENALNEQNRSQNLILAGQSEARRLSTWVSWLDRRQQPPVAELFARYLSAQIPTLVRLAEFQIQRSTNGWSFVLHGFIQDPSGGFLPVLERFETGLEQGVFRAQVQTSTRRQMLGADNSPSSAPPPGARTGARSDEKPFFITGVIR